MVHSRFLVFCFFNDTATTEIYTYWHTLSLHDALPICRWGRIIGCTPSVSPARKEEFSAPNRRPTGAKHRRHQQYGKGIRSEEHTSELPSLMRISYAVFCLKKKNTCKQHNLPPSTHQCK